MRKIIFLLAIIGLIAGLVVAYMSAITRRPPPPLFTPATNPYATGIYAQGIIESAQPSGSNINVFPEVTGTVKQILVTEGQTIHKGMPLLLIDDAIQRGTTLNLKRQADAAFVQLQLLRAEPRPESLEVVKAQVLVAEAVLKGSVDAYEKQRVAYAIDPKAISKNQLDSAAAQVATARGNLELARRQVALSRAGAWSYQIRNQERLYQAAEEAYRSAAALLGKYTLRAPSDGVVLAINPTVGSLVSTLGTYDTYSQGMDPVLVLGSGHDQYLQVRCFVDEILIPRLPNPTAMKAQMSPRGTNIRIPLEYVRVQPVLSPKIQLSDQRQERVDVRVLPIIFRLVKPKNVTLYPGQLVDIFIAG